MIILLIALLDMLNEAFKPMDLYLGAFILDSMIIKGVIEVIKEKRG